MIVRPDLLNGKKMRLLTRRLGGRGEVLWALVALWGHCETSRAFVFEMDAEELGAICDWQGEPELLWATFLDLHVIDPTPDGRWLVHEWSEFNPTLVSNWRPRGGRPVKTDEAPHRNHPVSMRFPCEAHPETTSEQSYSPIETTSKPHANHTESEKRREEKCRVEKSGEELDSESNSPSESSSIRIDGEGDLDPVTSKTPVEVELDRLTFEAALNAPLSPGIGRLALQASIADSQQGLTLEVTEAPLPSPEQIYAAYPRHACRKAALESIRRVLKKKEIGVVELLERVTAYAAAVKGWTKAQRFNADGRDTVPHPTTWFNQGRYADDPAEWVMAPERQTYAKPGIVQRPARTLANPLDAPPAGLDWRALMDVYYPDWNTALDWYQLPLDVRSDVLKKRKEAAA